MIRARSFSRPGALALVLSSLFLAPFAQAADRPSGAREPAGAEFPGAAAPAGLTAHIPPRPPGARSGSQFVAYVRGMDGATRERAIRTELLSGNIPAFLRQLKKVELGGEASVWVMPDYLAIGSDEDFVRFPASFETASAVARRFGFVLPTTTIVDAIYDQADLRLAPQTMTPGPAMTSTAYFELHDGKIHAQTGSRHLGQLVAGHKKDYVVTGRLASAATQEAIYGWHRGPGAPIQPLSLVHGSRYADYSHGVRLVAETVYLGGVARSYCDLLADPRPARLLSREGAIAGVRGILDRFAGPAFSPPAEPPATLVATLAATVAAAQ